MSNEPHNPLTDVRKGLGLLFRAARTAARKLPTKDLEEAVVTSAREVGRAIENVATTIEREVFGKNSPRPPEPPPREPRGGAGDKSDEPKPPGAA
jgi:hypothetical protein